MGDGKISGNYRSRGCEGIAGSIAFTDVTVTSETKEYGNLSYRSPDSDDTKEPWNVQVFTIPKIDVCGTRSSRRP